MGCHILLYFQYFVFCEQEYIYIYINCRNKSDTSLLITVSFKKGVPELLTEHHPEGVLGSGGTALRILDPAIDGGE
jgi:hypothetical protein